MPTSSYSGPEGRKRKAFAAGIPHGRLNELKRKELYEEFLQQPALNASVGVAVNLNWEILGVNSDIADTDCTFAEKGGINLATPTTTPAANDFATIRPHLDTTQTAWAKAGLWGSENSVQFETQIRITSLTACAVLAGLREDTTIPADMEVVGSDDNAAFFFYSDDSTIVTGSGGNTWTIVENINTVDTLSTTGFATAAATDYNLAIRIDSDRCASYYINNTFIRKGAALKDAVDFIPFIAVMTDTTAVKSIDIRYVRMSRLY